jgi:hypothetical protein
MLFRENFSYKNNEYNQEYSTCNSKPLKNIFLGTRVLKMVQKLDIVPRRSKAYKKVNYTLSYSLIIRSIVNNLGISKKMMRINQGS